MNQTLTTNLVDIAVQIVVKHFKTEVLSLIQTWDDFEGVLGTLRNESSKLEAINSDKNIMVYLQQEIQLRDDVFNKMFLKNN